jgi:glutathione S-transferase
MALKYAGIELEHREISLREKPKSMLLASPKGTVPVLCVGEQVIDQSIDIMHWALRFSDPNDWLDVDQVLAQAWIEKSDGPFKKLLDQYKYPNRFPDVDQTQLLDEASELMLLPMEAALNAHQYLLGNQASWVDIAIFPFIRQFSMADQQKFGALDLPRCKQWLETHIASDLFVSVMEKHPTWID